MKKVLLLGAMAFFAFNIANAQSNLQISTAQTNEDAVKLQKEQQMNVSEEQKLNQLNQTAEPKKQSATRQNTGTGKNVRPVNTNSSEVASPVPTEATATPAANPIDQPTSPKVKPAPETTDHPQRVGRRRPNFVKPSNANNTIVNKKIGSEQPAPGSKSVTVSPSVIKPKHPANPKNQNNDGKVKTDR